MAHEDSEILVFVLNKSLKSTCVSRALVPKLESNKLKREF